MASSARVLSQPSEQGPFVTPDRGGAGCRRRQPLPERPRIRECAGKLLRAGPGNAPRFPARARQCTVDRLVREQQKASARPGGSEAPAGGGAGAGRGLWPPAGQGSTWRCGRGDGPCQRDRASRNAQDRHSGREQEKHCVSPARARRCPVDRQAREQPPTGRLHAQRRARAMAPARPREAGADRKLSCFPVRQSRQPERCHPSVRSGALPHP
jgi:hypothetical protein